MKSLVFQTVHSIGARDHARHGGAQVREEEGAEGGGGAGQQEDETGGGQDGPPEHRRQDAAGAVRHLQAQGRGELQGGHPALP